jgi:hypothetical protein
MKLRALVWFIAVASIGGAAACGSDEASPGLAPRVAVCRKLNEHLFRLSPEAHLDGLSEAAQLAQLEKLQAQVPIEDLAQCAAADPAAIDCMQKAADLAAVRACIPAIRG